MTKAEIKECVRQLEAAENHVDQVVSKMPRPNRPLSMDSSDGMAILMVEQLKAKISVTINQIWSCKNEE